MKSSARRDRRGKGADVGVGKKTARKRAVGTREHIIAYLAEVSDLLDTNGMASTQLAAAVGYPGSSVAFAQLLSGMERSGLIEREVRGKRTYRISLGSAQVSVAGEGRPASIGPTQAAGLVEADVSEGGFDYDELARRLLVQLVRRLAAAEPGTGQAGTGQAGTGQAGTGQAGTGQADPTALQETVRGLEYELATVWTKHGKLAEENVRLREQLQAAQRSLALARERVRQLPITSDLDDSEVVLLQRLLSPGGSLSLKGVR
jgi:hypothetical protein